MTILESSVCDIKLSKGSAKFQPILCLSFLKIRDFEKGDLFMCEYRVDEIEDECSYNADINDPICR